MTPLDLEGVDEKAAVVLYDYFKRHPVEWLKNCVFTFDEHDKENPIKRFPMRPYVEIVANEYENEDILHIPKSRQMSLSWLLMALILHEAQFFGFRLQAVFSKKEDDAFVLVERAKFMWDQQPAWLKNMCPLDRKMKDMQLGHIYFQNGSKIRGFAQGKDQIRQYVPSTALLDEAAFQDKLQETYGALVPCAQKIVTMSSADAGFFQRLVEL
jgi:hypothetical protein